MDSKIESGRARESLRFTRQRHHDNGVQETAVSMSLMQGLSLVVVRARR